MGDLIARLADDVHNQPMAIGCLVRRDLWRHLFDYQSSPQLLQRICPPASFWAIQPDVQGLADRSAQGTRNWRAPGLAPTRAALSRPARYRRSMVAVGGSWDVGFYSPTFQPRADSDHAFI